MDVIEDWRVVHVARHHGFEVYVIYDDGVRLEAVIDLGETVTPPS